jgi:hypothetical protein
LIPGQRGDAMDPRDTLSPFGVLAFVAWDHAWNNFHFGKPGEIERTADLIRDAGIRTVRMDFFWSDLEPEPGRFDFARYDRIVKILRDRGLSLLGILLYNPRWREPWNAAPDRLAYAAYARAVVRHFKKDIRLWEIWNEPDHPTYWQPQDDLTSYSALLKCVAPQIRAEDPSALVVLGGMAFNFAAHLRQVYQKAGKEAFDIVNIHPFTNPLSDGPLRQLRDHVLEAQEVQKEFDDVAKPLWLTEIGCPGLTVSNDATTWWLGKSPNEEQQAAWLREVYTESLRWPGVERVFWAFLRDTPPHFGDAVDHFGILRADLTPKPAWHAYAAVTGASQQPWP